MKPKNYLVITTIMFFLTALILPSDKMINGFDTPNLMILGFLSLIARLQCK